ncbi:MAG: hypothetical protein ACTSUB_07930 [Candidatus Thorarchaeota archaeon]
MQMSKNLLLSTMFLFILGIGVPIVAAQGTGIQYQNSSGTVTLSTDDIELRITGVGETPHFHWWDPNSPDVDYHAMFVRLFEANDTDTDGVYDNGTDTMVGSSFALPSTDWDVSEFDLEQEGDNVTAVHFNFTSTIEHNPRPAAGGYGNLPTMDVFDVYVQIRVHMDLTNPGEMKFDLIVDGWNWTYTDSILVFMFTITESAHGQNQAGTSSPDVFGHTGTKFSFGDAYMEYNTTALAAQNTLTVKASYAESAGAQAGTAIYLAFENFGNETLVYDPILGVDSSSDFISDNILLIGIGVALVALVVVFVVVRMK